MTIKDLTDTPNFSKESIKRLGRKIRKDEDYDQNLLDNFIIWNSEVVEYCTQLARSHYLDTQHIYHDLPPCLKNKIITPDIEFSSRVKTIDTLKQKLQRLNKTSLDRIQDRAGIRIDGLLTLKNQEAVANSLASTFISSGAKKVDIKNLNNSPHTGYRAIHLRIESPAGCAEVQIRTHLQSAWANAYETLADVLGRDIRYTNEVKSNTETPSNLLINISNILHDLQIGFDEKIEKIHKSENSVRDIYVQIAIDHYQKLTIIHEKLRDLDDFLKKRRLE